MILGGIGGIGGYTMLYDINTKRLNIIKRTTNVYTFKYNDFNIIIILLILTIILYNLNI